MRATGKRCWSRSAATAKPDPVQRPKRETPTVKLYIAGESDLVSRVLTIRQACGTKLIIEHSAATEPAVVIQVMAGPPTER